MVDQRMLEEHRQVWRSFIKLTVYAIVGATIILVLMAIFLT